MAARARARPARRGRGADAEAMSPRAWLALWDGLHRLGLDLPRDRARGRDDPADLRRRRPLHSRRRADGGWLLSAHGTTPFRVGRRRPASAVLVGVLLLGANAILFVAERHVPIGLASLLIASVPLWIVLLRSPTGDRRRRVALVGVATGFTGIAVLVRPGGDASGRRRSCSSLASARSGRSARSSPRSCRCRTTRLSRRRSRCSRQAARAAPARRRPPGRRVARPRRRGRRAPCSGSSTSS